MAQIPEIPTEVSVIIRAEETVESFVRRALALAARQAGLPLTEQNLFVDALIAQYPSSTRMIWLRDDPTPRTTSQVRTEDFNFLLFLEYLREYPGAGKRKVSIKQVKALEGRVLQPFPIDEITRSELAKWQQDFIYRGGELGTGQPAPISRQGLVPRLQVLADKPDITWLPKIMRSYGWNEGAKLMEEWQRRPARIRPLNKDDVPNDFGPPVLNVITMDWLLNNKFERANNAYNEIINGKMWKTDKAKLQISKMLARTGITAQVQLQANRERGISFGDLTSSNVVAIEDVYIQFKAVNQSNRDALLFPDGLTAAIKDFNFHVAIKGKAKHTPNGVEVTVEEVGIFAKETYDFLNDGTMHGYVTDDQPLGIWKDVGYVTNNSFNEWREKTGKGGDFLVYSDIKVTKLNPPDVFIVPFQY